MKQGENNKEKEPKVPRSGGGKEADGGSPPGSSSSSSKSSSSEKEDADDEGEQEDEPHGGSPKGPPPPRDPGGGDPDPGRGARDEERSRGRSGSYGITAKLREQNELKPPKFPVVSNLREFKLELHDRTTLCGQDKPQEDVVRWFSAVEVEGVKEKDLVDPGRDFESLDRKLEIAVQSILPKELEMKINNVKADLLAKRGRLISGRQVLWHIYRH